MACKSMTFVYYSNTWHDTFANVEMLRERRWKKKEVWDQVQKKKKKDRKE